MNATSSPNKPMRALIYCRVSSVRQVNEGHGLDSQERRCRDYAKGKGYVVEKVFLDEGVSGGLFERPAMQELINHIDKNLGRQYVIVFDDLSRFARDLKVHIQLKTELKSRGAVIECPNFNIEDSPEGEYAEMIMAAGNQYQRKQNRRQVMQKMKARLESGYWSFCPPPGLHNKIVSGRGRILVSREPFATIYKEAIERYAGDLLNTLDEVRNFIIEKYMMTGINKVISLNGVVNILTEELYAGYMKYSPWGIPFMKAKHDGFITFETYKIVQEKLSGRSKPRLRKDYSLDFPLRGFILCDKCRRPMTASWNKGRNKRYPNYWCKTINCPARNKTVNKDRVHSQFEALLSGLKPRADSFDLVDSVFQNVWEERKLKHMDFSAIKAKEIEEIKSQIGNYVKLIGKARSETLMTRYENMILELENKLKVIDVDLPVEKYTEKEFGTAQSLVFDTLRNPMTMWKSDNIENKRTIMYMYFDERPGYDLQSGFGTATLSLPVKLMSEEQPSKNNLVDILENSLSQIEAYIWKWFPKLQHLKLSHGFNLSHEEI